MSTSSEWAVEAHGLFKSFGTNRAVDGVDLGVRTGSIYGVLGPNGAGKTTASTNCTGHARRERARSTKTGIGAGAVGYGVPVP